jgi:hypothetical protein
VDENGRKVLKEETKKKRTLWKGKEEKELKTNVNVYVSGLALNQSRLFPESHLKKHTKKKGKNKRIVRKNKREAKENSWSKDEWVCAVTNPIRRMSK